VINATPEIAQRIPDVKVVIVGRGPEFDEVIKLAKRMNNRLGNKTIIVAGTQPNDVMPKIMSSADVVISVGRSALEAMACGKPVIIAGKTGFGGILTENNITQLKMYNFSGRNSSERTTSTRIAESVLKLLTSEKYRESSGSLGRQIVEKEFDVRKVAGQIENVYLRAVRT
jgi:glycosyltransferase involved in cell wall biosynthesis